MSTDTTTDYGLVLVTSSNTHRLEVWESAGHELKVVLRNHRNGKLITSKVFRYCETQHDDSERWLNDKVGYPNDFAGFLGARIWEKM